MMYDMMPGKAAVQKVRRVVRRLLLRIVSLVRNEVLRAHIDGAQQLNMLAIGRHTYGLPKIDSYRGSPARVTIGSFCSIAPDVTLITGGVHPSDWVALFPLRARWHLDGAYGDGMPSTRGPIDIGSDVWIGSGSVILSGVSIGHGAIICAGSVVTRNIPPFAIAGGVPARIIRFRFEASVIQDLLSISWWEWDDDKIRAAVPLLSSNRVYKFIELYLDS